METGDIKAWQPWSKRILRIIAALALAITPFPANAGPMEVIITDQAVVESLRKGDLDALKKMNSADAKRAVDNYEKLLDKEAFTARMAVEYFSIVHAPGLLLNGFKNKNGDVKLSTVTALYRLPQVEVTPYRKQLRSLLADEPKYIAGSENATIHSIYLFNLTRLVGRLYNVPVREANDVSERLVRESDYNNVLDATAAQALQEK